MALASRKRALVQDNFRHIKPRQPKIEYLNKIPNEILHLILNQITDFKILIRLRRTCRRIRDSVDDIIRKRLETIPWTTSVLNNRYGENTMIFMLGDIHHDINGKFITQGSGGDMAKIIYRMLTGEKFRAEIDMMTGAIISIIKFNWFILHPYLKCRALYCDQIDTVNGLIQIHVNFVSNSVLHDYSEEDSDDLGDYDYSKYCNDISCSNSEDETVDEYFLDPGD